MSSNRTLHVQNAMLYMMVPLIRNIVPIFTLPIMTRLLSPNDYGIIGMITMLVSFSSLFSLGVYTASYRFYFKYKNNMSELRAMLSTNLIFIIGTAVLYGFFLLLFYRYLNEFFFHGSLAFGWVFLALISNVMQNINYINQAIFQAQYKGMDWAKNEFAYFIVQITLTLFLVISRTFTFEALIIASLAAEIVKSVMSFIKLRGYFASIFKVRYIKESVSYSWPNIPTTLISYIYLYLDRILLNRFYGLFEVGLLEMSNRLSLGLKMTIEGVDGVMSPLNLELLTENTKESLERMARTNIKIMYFVLFVGLLLILFTKEVVVLLTTSKFHFIMYVAPIYIYYNIFSILTIPSYWLIYHRTDKVYIKIIMNGVFLISSVGINILLIPKYGIMGAAFAIMISAAITQIIQFIIGLKITPIPLNIAQIVLLFGFVITQTVVVYVLYYYNVPILYDILLKLVILSLYIILGFWSRIVSVEEVKSIMIDMQKKIKDKYLGMSSQKITNDVEVI